MQKKKNKKKKKKKKKRKKNNKQKRARSDPNPLIFFLGEGYSIGQDNRHLCNSSLRSFKV